MSAFAASLRLELLAVLGRDVPDPYPVAAPTETFEAVYRDHYRDVYRYVLLSLRRATTRMMSWQTHSTAHSWLGDRATALPAVPCPGSLSSRAASWSIGGGESG